jgi:hypothetical protein
MVVKLFVALAALLLLSGCCRLFGICSSVNVHTSIDAPTQITRQSLPDHRILQEEPSFAEASVPLGDSRAGLVSNSR